MATVHVVYNGENYDYPTDELDVGVQSTDEEIINALSRHADIPLGKLRGFVVNSNMETGDITLSPRALFGC